MSLGGSALAGVVSARSKGNNRNRRLRMARASVRGLCPPQERRPPQRKHDSIVVSDVRIVRKILTKIGTAAAANSRTPACLMLHCDATNKGPIRFVALHDPRFLKSR